MCFMTATLAQCTLPLARRCGLGWGDSMEDDIRSPRRSFSLVCAHRRPHQPAVAFKMWLDNAMQ